MMSCDNTLVTGARTSIPLSLRCIYFIASASQERKRPRKLSQRILECTIEEVSLAPANKKVQRWHVDKTVRMCHLFYGNPAVLHDLTLCVSLLQGGQETLWDYLRGEEDRRRHSGSRNTRLKPRG